MSHRDVVDAGVQPGTILAGKYRVESVLGVGGMGVVVAAHHLQLDEKVALKFLKPDALANPDALARFEREARAAVKIKSEHVARVSDVGRLESGAPYMVMEYLEGTDLDAWVRGRGVLPAEQAAEFVLQACEAIAEAHALGIVHRDLKPANLFCVRRADGLLSVKVLDFGISKTGAAGGKVGVTTTGSALGSPLYMSPEQLQSAKRVDWRTDIWSLGVILFELVSARAPFESELVTELAIMIATREPLSLRALVPGLPPGFEGIVARCMQKEREERFQSVGELASALARFAPARAQASVERIVRTVEAARAQQARAGQTSGQVDELAVTSSASPMRAGGGTDAAWGTTGPSGRRRRRAKLLAGAMAGPAILVVCLAGWLAAQALRTPPPATAISGGAASAPPEAPASASSVTAAASAWLPVPSAPSSSSSSSSAAASASASLTPSKPPWRPPPVVPPTARPGCHPPYVIDSAGHRQYKPECL